MVIPQSVVAAESEQAAAEGLSYRPGGNAATMPVADMGVPDGSVTACLRLTDEEFAAKLQALYAHRTQIGPDSFGRRASLPLLRTWRGTVYYAILSPDVAGDVQHDLFAGVAP